MFLPVSDCFWFYCCLRNEGDEGDARAGLGGGAPAPCCVPRERPQLRALLGTPSRAPPRPRAASQHRSWHWCQEGACNKAGTKPTPPTGIAGLAKAGLRGRRAGAVPSPHGGGYFGSPPPLAGATRLLLLLCLSPRAKMSLPGLKLGPRAAASGLSERCPRGQEGSESPGRDGRPLLAPGAFAKQIATPLPCPLVGDIPPDPL